MTPLNGQRLWSRFRSLYWKLSGTLLLLLAVLAVAYIYIAAFTARMYFQEANQRLNGMVARYIADKTRPITDGRIDHTALQKLFSDVMVINPSVEVYLLDPGGKILAYSAPDSAIKRTVVALEPIQRFLHSSQEEFIPGDDPRGISRKKGFSAATLEHNGRVEGYLYVILGGEEYDSAVEMMFGSYILRLSARTMVLTLIGAAILGLLAFRVITRGLRTTITTVQNFRNGDRNARIAASTTPEVNELASAFNEMAGTIATYIDEIKTMDNLRRDLVANVSHDLRTPLVSIHGYVETILMKDDALSEEDRKKYLMTVLRSTEKLKKLVDELFELSKLEARQTPPMLEQFSVGELVQDVVQKHLLLAERRGVRIQTVLPRELPYVVADIGLIERVFQNLLDNAIRYSEERGTITIALRAGTAGVNVSIADTGKGISPEELPYIFDRYRRGSQFTAPDDSGAGLGLAIVKKILDIHGVRITVESTPKQGTAFSFMLPAEAEERQG